MDTLSIIILLIALFMIVYPVIAQDRSPIPETSGNVYKIQTSGEFDKLLSSTATVFVDFYADWCPPCRAIAPIFSQLADAHSAPGKLAFAKVNTDHVKGVAARYDISAMPTFVVFQGGKPKGVAVESLAGRHTVVRDDDGLIERVRGADQVALKAIVQALSDKSTDAKAKM